MSTVGAIGRNTQALVGAISTKFPNAVIDASKGNIGVSLKGHHVTVKGNKSPEQAVRMVENALYA